MSDARPVCPTCAGMRIIATKRYHDNVPMIEEPCPDCKDGRMPLERMAAIVNAVFGWNECWRPIYTHATRVYLQSVKP